VTEQTQEPLSLPIPVSFCAGFTGPCRGGVSALSFLRDPVSFTQAIRVRTAPWTLCRSHLFIHSFNTNGQMLLSPRTGRGPEMTLSSLTQAQVPPGESTAEGTSSVSPGLTAGGLENGNPWRFQQSRDRITYKGPLASLSVLPPSILACLVTSSDCILVIVTVYCVRRDVLCLTERKSFPLNRGLHSLHVTFQVQVCGRMASVELVLTVPLPSIRAVTWL
jgi:hypothetical protein